MKSILHLWPLFLNKQEAENVTETYFFEFSDNENENCALQINKGACQFIDKKPKNYTNKITIETKGLTTLLSNQKTSEQLIAERKLKIDGNDKNLKKFKRYFSGEISSKQKTPNCYVITENEKNQLNNKWIKPQKILVLNASPRKDKGAIGFIYNFLKQGFEACGCDTDVVYVADLENHPCKGCFTCWGMGKKCVYTDDTNEFILSIPNYDLMILAAPVYVDGLPGMLKNILDRMICLLEAEFILKDDHCRHPIRYPKMPHLLLFSTIGFTEQDNFYPMVDHVKKFCQNIHLTYIGEILPPTAWMMTITPFQPLYKPVFEAITLAGKEIINTGKISKDVYKRIITPIFTRAQIFAIHNRNIG